MTRAWIAFLALAFVVMLVADRVAGVPVIWR